MRSVLRGVASGRPTGARVPAIVFTKGGGQWLDSLATCGAQCVGLDWTVDLGGRAPRASATRVALQGNLDPIVLLADAATVVRARRPPSFAPRAPAPGHIFNLGHGIVPATPPENVAVLVETVHRESRALRAGC